MHRFGPACSSQCQKSKKDPRNFSNYSRELFCVSRAIVLATTMGLHRSLAERLSQELFGFTFPAIPDNDHKKKDPALAGSTTIGGMRSALCL